MNKRLQECEKMVGIFLDDERIPEDVTWVDYKSNIYWIIVRNSTEFFTALDKIKPDIISFDHDIQEFAFSQRPVEITGLDILKRFVCNCIQNKQLLPMCVFHTKNICGKENMSHFYKNAVKFQEQSMSEN